ncbi:hypothetical protein B0H63DRAFT_528144 [Podospora didyma]|uniref:Uncharacterized protein n=1 Tax=Podospora didyma TaxID=330526 RepID=A0AAE0K675_9PEZI|nr:hypothetical protein B0H63DRAFT_528144 [Podospora didyma]
MFVILLLAGVASLLIRRRRRAKRVSPPSPRHRPQELHEDTAKGGEEVDAKPQLGADAAASLDAGKLESLEHDGPTVLQPRPTLDAQQPVGSYTESGPVELPAAYRDTEETSQVVSAHAAGKIPEPGEANREAPGGEEDEAVRLVEHERRLADRRAALQTTLRLLEEDERLKREQEEVQQQLNELRKKS